MLQQHTKVRCFLLEMLSNIAHKLEDKEDFRISSITKFTALAFACTVSLELAKEQSENEHHVINLGWEVSFI